MEVGVDNSPEIVGVAMEFPVVDGAGLSSPPTLPPRLRRRLTETKASPQPQATSILQASLTDCLSYDLRMEFVRFELLSYMRKRALGLMERSKSFYSKLVKTDINGKDQAASAAQPKRHPSAAPMCSSFSLISLLYLPFPLLISGPSPQHYYHLQRQKGIGADVEDMPPSTAGGIPFRAQPK
ncbi:hypothetical protein L1887_22765 [Cichorium endivia]|nr:hypothetical protein L1887_22765 [Cichorium endivia]